MCVYVAFDVDGKKDLGHRGSSKRMSGGHAQVVMSPVMDRLDFLRKKSSCILDGNCYFLFTTACLKLPCSLNGHALSSPSYPFHSFPFHRCFKFSAKMKLVPCIYALIKMPYPIVIVPCLFSTPSTGQLEPKSTPKPWGRSFMDRDGLPNPYKFSGSIPCFLIFYLLTACRTA